MNLYGDLNIDPSASEEEIKKAYRKKAMKSHPDRGGDAEQFHQITKAYDILSNPDSRNRYDQTGDESASDFEKQVAANMVRVFEMIIDADDVSGDFIKLASRTTNNAIVEHKKEIKKNKKQIQKLTKKKGRITTKGDNLYEDILDKRLYALDQSIIFENSQIAILKEILERLKNYKDTQATNEPMGSFESMIREASTSSTFYFTKEN